MPHWQSGVDKPGMLSVHNYLAIRVAHQKDESKRSIARRLHHSQKTVAKVIASETGRPEPYRRSKAPAYPKLGPFTGVIDAIMAADESAPAKQRHTAMQVYRRLVNEEQYRGKYDPVRRYINMRRRGRRETLVPLDHAPGERMECDFGEIAVDYPDGRRIKDVLIVTWSFSHAVFMIATPNQRTESVLHGMVAAFEFFGHLAREVWWDNPKTIATVILSGRERVLNENYAALASHYRFDPRACMPAKGQEKPDAESGVKRPAGKRSAPIIKRVFTTPPGQRPRPMRQKTARPSARRYPPSTCPGPTCGDSTDCCPLITKEKCDDECIPPEPLARPAAAAQPQGVEAADDAQ